MKSFRLELRRAIEYYNSPPSSFYLMWLLLGLIVFVIDLTNQRFGILTFGYLIAALVAGRTWFKMIFGKFD